MSRIDSYIRNVEEIRKSLEAMNKMFEPAKVVAETVAQQKKAIDQMFEQVNYARVLNQMKHVADTVNRINVQLPSIKNYLEAYNQTRKFIDNYEDFIEVQDEDQLKEIQEAKENFGSMPKLEPIIKDFSPEQEEQFNEAMSTANEEAAKGKKAKESLPTKISNSLTVFVGLPQIPEAVEKYYSAIKVIFSILKDGI